MSQHPHQLHAQAALWSLKAALRYLADHRDAVLIRRPQLGPARTRPRSLAALEEYDELLRTEKAERRAGSLTGLKPSAGAAAPGDAPGLLDLKANVDEYLDEALGLLAYAHHRDALLAWGDPWPRFLEEIAGAEDPRVAWVAAVLPVTPPGIAAAVQTALAQADARLRSVIGLDADRLAPPLAPECPACGLRRLRIQHSAPDSARWTIVCTSGGGCRCLGEDCSCGMPVRERRVRHIWAADSELAVSLRAGVAAQSLRLAA